MEADWCYIDISGLSNETDVSLERKSEWSLPSYHFAHLLHNSFGPPRINCSSKLEGDCALVGLSCVLGINLSYQAFNILPIFTANTVSWTQALGVCLLQEEENNRREQNRTEQNRMVQLEETFKDHLFQLS